MHKSIDNATGDFLEKGKLPFGIQGFVRRVGRPRDEWPSCLLKEAVAIAGNVAALEALISRPAAWKAAVWRHCSQPR